MRRVYDVLRGTHHTVLLFAAGTDPAPLLQRAAYLERRYPDPTLVRVWVVSTDTPASSDPRLLHDPGGQVHRAYGADRPTSFVIRPDSHIACRIRPATATQLLADLDARLQDETGRSPRGKPPTSSTISITESSPTGSSTTGRKAS